MRPFLRKYVKRLRRKENRLWNVLLLFFLGSYTHTLWQSIFAGAPAGRHLNGTQFRKKIFSREREWANGSKQFKCCGREIFDYWNVCWVSFSLKKNSKSKGGKNARQKLCYRVGIWFNWNLTLSAVLMCVEQVFFSPPFFGSRVVVSSQNGKRGEKNIKEKIKFFFCV